MESLERVKQNMSPLKKSWTYIWHVKHFGGEIVFVIVKNAFDMEQHWSIGALWEYI